MIPEFIITLFLQLKSIQVRIQLDQIWLLDGNWFKFDSLVILIMFILHNYKLIMSFYFIFQF